ncbi:MAG: hypothetical protein IPI43_28870 [Sandaracinaceae bacterium]|nr:hypothetical protein [Sandaracinaceae bacterium]
MSERVRGRRPGRTRLTLALLGALALLPACRSAPSASALREVRAGDDAFQLTVLEDLSRAHDVFRSAQAVYSSTDRGLYVYPTSGPPRPTRLGLSAGLPSEDVLAARLLPDDTLVVLTSRGLGAVATRAGVSAPELPAPPLGVLYDIEVYDGLLYACGELGLGRLERVAAGGWRTLSELPGEPLTCHDLQLGRDDTLFVLGESSLAQLEGDVLREHRAPAFPQGRPRALAEGTDGELYVLLEREAGGELARFHAGAWWSYSWTAVSGDAPVVGLIAQAGVPLLVTSDAVLALSAESRGGTRLRATAQHTGNPLLFRTTPSLPRATAPLGLEAHRSRSAPLVSAPVATDEPDAAPALYAHALPQVGAAYEAAFASSEWVYLAQPGRGLLEVGEARRPLSAADFRDLRPLTLAIDVRGGTWLRADDGTLVRVEQGEARVYPHGRASALLESHDATGAPHASDPWAALVSPAGEVVLVSPTPSGWVEQARVPDAQQLANVRLGVRSTDGHIWLLAHGGRAEWPRGYGLAHRDPEGVWSFVDVPLEARGALDAVTQLVSRGDVAFVAGPGGLARVPAQGAAEVLFRGPVSDLERAGSTLAFVADGNLFQLHLDAAAGTRAHPVPLDEEASEALRRVNPAGFALTPTHALITGEGGLVLGTLAAETPGELAGGAWEALLGSAAGLLAHDVDVGAQGTWVARRDGAVLLFTPR